MKKILYVLLLFGVTIVGYFSLTKNESRPASNSQNNILVKFLPGVISEEKLTQRVDEINNEHLYSLLKAYGVTTVTSIFRNRYDDQGRLVKKSLVSGKQLLNGWFEMRLNEEFNVEDFVDQLRKHEGVIYASIEKPMPLKPAVAPNDGNYGSQWHLNNPNNQNFDIDAEAAWNINNGRNDVIIAVLDGGIDYTHSDLDPGDRTRIIAGIDTGDDDNDPMDDMADTGDSYANHGTRIAGVIGARTNNNQQVAGVMWNCQIMPVKMVRNSGSIKIPHIIDWNFNETAFPSDVADALDYAVSNGAHVINLSYSFASSGWMTNEIILQIPLLLDAIDNAYQNNVVITASMGNEYNEDNTLRYPAGFNEQVIAVGATNPNGTRRSSSNTGSHIDLAAPGTDILTTSRGGGIINTSGTSFSAPIVAGVAGLIISQGKDRGFNLTNDDVKHIMELTATDIAPTGFDEETGHGIVNANNALQLLNQPNVVYHYTSTGGTATKTQNYSQWIWSASRWGLAAATYFNVDEYRINTHVTFATPFCSAPTVWMRERESKTVGWGNPNSGLPYAKITNITTTGFDLEYVTYYVRYNVSGQTLNQWVPAAPASTYMAYTAVGQPNIAGTAGPIAGPEQICTSGAFTVNNLPAGVTVNWTSSNPSGLSINSATGQATRVNNFNGQVTVSATATGICGAVSLPGVNVIVGSGVSPFLILTQNVSCVNNKAYLNITHTVLPGSAQKEFKYYAKDNSVSSNPYVLKEDNYGTTGVGGTDFPLGLANRQYLLRVEVITPCGTIQADGGVNAPACTGGGGAASIAVYPNPSTSELTIEAVTEETESLSVTQNADEISLNNQVQEFTAKLTNGNGASVKSGASENGLLFWDTRGLQPGFYYLQVNTGYDVVTKTIYIKH